MTDIIARRQFAPLYIWLDIAFLCVFLALLLMKKKYMTVLVGLVMGVVYMLVDYGIFHLVCHSRTISEGHSLFLVLLWMSVSYGFTNFTWIWLWLSKDEHLFEWSLLILGWWFCCPLLTQTFAPRKMAVKAVPLADYAQTVGALAGAADCLRTEEVYAGLPLGEPMLVFCGFYGDRMNQALNAMRRTGLRIPYKAMLTAANRGWRPAELFAELQKEHAAMTAKR